MGLLDSLGKRVRNFDAFAKTMDDFKVRTRSGGVVSIIGYAIMIALFMSELQMYLSNRVETKLVVDNSRGEGMSIYMDIQFPKISCNLLGIDALDMTGNAQLEISHDLYKIRTDQSGEPIVDQQKDKVVPKTSMRESKDKELEGDEMYCGSCYGASVGWRAAPSVLVLCSSKPKDDVTL